MAGRFLSGIITGMKRELCEFELQNSRISHSSTIMGLKLIGCEYLYKNLSSKYGRPASRTTSQ